MGQKKTESWSGNVGGKNKGQDIWTWYLVRWHFLTKICASVPANPEIMAKWLEARQPKVKPLGARSIEEINEEALASIERGEGEIDENDSMLVFQRDQGRLVMRSGTIKAHIKDCARVVSAQAVAKVQGERAFSTRVINGVYQYERAYWVPLRRPGAGVIFEADGAFDKPVHTRDMRGRPINALKRFEFVEPPCYLEFHLKVLAKSVPASDLHKLFNYGGTHGYAGERSDGEGRYEYEFTKADSPEVEPPREAASDSHSERDRSETRADSTRIGA